MGYPGYTPLMEAPSSDDIILLKSSPHIRRTVTVVATSSWCSRAAGIYCRFRSLVAPADWDDATGGETSQTWVSY